MMNQGSCFFRGTRSEVRSSRGMCNIDRRRSPNRRLITRIGRDRGTATTSFCHFERSEKSVFRRPISGIRGSNFCHFERSEKSAFFDVRSQMFEVRLKVHWHFLVFAPFALSRLSPPRLPCEIAGIKSEPVPYCLLYQLMINFV